MPCDFMHSKNVSGNTVSFIALVKAKQVFPLRVTEPRFCVLFLDTFVLNTNLSTPICSGIFIAPRLLYIIV